MLTVILFVLLYIATLKQVGHNSVLVKHRQIQIEERRKTYIWRFFPDSGYASAIELGDNPKPPLDEKFERSKKQNWMGNKLKGVVLTYVPGITKGNALHELVSILVGKEVKYTDSFKNLVEFYDIAKLLQKEEIKFISQHHPSVDLYEDKIIPFEGFRWTSDVEFGRQILNGVNCVLLKRCTALPENFPVTNEIVGELLCRGVPLEKEMQV